MYTRVLYKTASPAEGRSSVFEGMIGTAARKRSIAERFSEAPPFANPGLKLEQGD